MSFDNRAAGGSGSRFWIAAINENGSTPDIKDFVTGCYRISEARWYIKEYGQALNYGVYDWKLGVWVQV